MKRMKKKVVAMVTLAMFVMTLLPMAAFAADTNAARPDETRSQIKTDVENVEVNPGEAVDVELFLRDKDGKDITDSQGTVLAWVEDAKHNVVYDVAFNADQTVRLDNGKAFYGNSDGKALETITLDKAGTYTIHAGVLSTADGQEISGTENVIYDKKDITEFNTVENHNTIVVTPFDQDKITFNGQNADADDVFAVSKSTLENAGFKFNGIATYTIKGQLFDGDGKTMNGVDVTLSSNKDALVLADEAVKTDGSGKFDIEFSMTEETNASITVKTSDLEYTIKVNAADTDLDTIETVKEDGYVLAGTDTKNWPNASKKFTDAVQFDITDQNGNVVLNGLTDAEPATNQNDADHSKYVKVTKPGNSTLDAKDLKLVWDSEEEVYTVEYVGNAPKKDLVEGEYTVTVALLSDDNATATFNVAKFGDVEEVEVETYAKAKNSDNKTYVKVEDEIALGDDLGLKAKYVDENGLKINAPKDKVVLGADGKAIAAEYAHKFSNDYYEYALQTNTVANEALIGTVIKVKAFDNNEKKLVEKELTVVDAYDSYGLAFDSNKGEVNIDNNVEVSVVDADDNVAKKVSGDVYAYVAKQSNEDAKVTVTADKKAAKGEFNIKVYSNKATTADIVVAVKVDNGAIYAGTLSYTFGEEDIPAGTSVVMTLGSTEMIINNEVVDMKDAAPFAQNNRTYVPFRALGEALGAQVEYDKDAKTVTYELGSTKIVMTLDSKTYTVNGAKKTMDVAPFAKDNRTYVPVRFVGEGLGFTVTGLTNANGQYVAVAFTK